MARNLDGASVVITGASSGIGAAAARAFASAGAQVHAVARRLDRLEALANEQPGITPHALDVTDRDAVFALAEQVKCDVAVANAGVMSLGSFLDMPWEAIERQMDVNFDGLVHTLQAFGRQMRDRDDGILMPVSSIVSVQALPSYAAYCASKYAVRALAEALRMELRGTGVHVVHVLPGATATELHSHMDPSQVPATTKNRKRVPPEQVARKMVAAARRPRPTVLCDAPARALYWAKRATPGLVEALVTRVTSRTRNNA